MIIQQIRKPMLITLVCIETTNGCDNSMAGNSVSNWEDCKTARADHVRQVRHIGSELASWSMVGARWEMSIRREQHLRVECSPGMMSTPRGQFPGRSPGLDPGQFV